MSVPASTIDRFKVETTFGDGYVVHTTYEWEFSTRGPKRSSTWEEVRRIGSGAFGSVWLEKEQEGGLLRAVKRLQRASLQRVEFSREIQALIAVGDVSCFSFDITLSLDSPALAQTPFRGILWLV